MAGARKKPKLERFTYGEYLTWDDDRRYELIDGVVYDMTPAPGTAHQWISIELGSAFRNALKNHPCRVFVAPFDVRLPDADEDDDEVVTVIQPDVAVICDRSKLDRRGCRGAPDLAVEIISPSTSSKDQITKRALYERHRVREFWVIHPVDRLLTVYKLGRGGRYGRSEIYSDDATVKVGVLPGVSIVLAELFPPADLLL